MQRNHLFIKAAGLHCYRRTTCRDTEREMNRSARRNMLKVVGIIMVVMLPVMLRYGLPSLVQCRKSAPSCARLLNLL